MINSEEEWNINESPKHQGLDLHNMGTSCDIMFRKDDSRSHPTEDKGLGNQPCLYAARKCWEPFNSLREKFVFEYEGGKY